MADPPPLDVTPSEEQDASGDGVMDASRPSPPSSTPSQRQVVATFSDDALNEPVSVLFQCIRLYKQANVYIGLEEDQSRSLESMSMGMMAGQSPISTVILPSTKKTHTNDTESQQLAQMLSQKTGMPVMVSYTIPPGSVTDVVKSKVCRYAASLL
jgi:hypothetical protein